ncbi:MAG TPA: Hsp20/alpha crystallin family protein [Chloroflexia bacterium]|nr:Hsp20/alpha crystallin family protein [Chloroflexia bacterium]
MANSTKDQGTIDEEQRSKNEGQDSGDGQRGMAPYSVLPSPFSLMRRFSEDVDRLLSAISTGNLSSPSSSGSSSSQQSTGLAPLQAPARSQASGGSTSLTTWAPSIEVTSSGDDLVVSADLPGVKPENVQVEVEGNNLIIKGDSRTESEKKDDGYWYTERSYGSFYRSIALPDSVNTDEVRAEFHNGVLKVFLPGGAKVLIPQRRHIKIKGVQLGVDQPQQEKGQNGR